MLEKSKSDSRIEIQENISLKPYTTYKIGGSARYFVEVANKQELFDSLLIAKANQWPFFILGAGSNVLVSDKGFAGLVIHLNDTEVDIKENQINAFAGVLWPKLVISAIHAGLEGLEFSANIPGSVGGCVRGNAGAYGKGVGDFVKSVEVICLDEEINLKIFSQEDCVFDYRESIFKKHPNWIISEVSFELNKSSRSIDELMAEIKKEAADRCAKQPLKYPSAGCFFKNVVYNDGLSKYQSWVSNGKIAAARFIDEAGLKGCRVGDAQISDEHANFIINLGRATADDVVQLISLVKMKVRDQFGVQLEEEIVYVGFNE